MLLGYLIGRAATTKGVQDDVALVGRDQYSSLGDHELQFVYAWPYFVFLVAIGGGILQT